MTRILTGKSVVDEMRPGLAARVERLVSAGARPCLAVVRVGARADDVIYEDVIAKYAASVGVVLRRDALRSDADDALLLRTVRALADDARVHGVLVFSPLPDDVDEAAALAAIPPAKDVDGVTAAQMAGLYAMKKYGENGGGMFFPCTAEAVIRMLDHYGIPLARARAVVVGRSTVIGKPAAHLLLARDATVTICHGETPDLSKITRDADILVCAAGLASGDRARRLGVDHFSPGQTIIDVAMNVDAKGVYGDADADAAEGVVAAITPVPGGLGAVTTMALMEHVIRATETSPRG